MKGCVGGATLPTPPQRTGAALEGTWKRFKSNLIPRNFFRFRVVVVLYYAWAIICRWWSGGLQSKDWYGSAVRYQLREFVRSFGRSFVRLHSYALLFSRLRTTAAAPVKTSSCFFFCLPPFLFLRKKSCFEGVDDPCFVCFVLPGASSPGGGGHG